MNRGYLCLKTSKWGQLTTADDVKLLTARATSCE